MDAPQYSDDELIYVDPETKTVVGRVVLGEDGRPQNGYTINGGSYPFGTYRSMRGKFQLEGKRVEEGGGGMTLEEALPKLLDDSL